MPATLTVLGDGAWGTAIALLLARRSDLHVRLWSAREANGVALKETRENRRFLPGVSIPESLLLTTSEREAVDGADLWISAIPTVYLRPTLARFRGLVSAPAVVSLTKGIEIDTFRRPTEIIAEVLDTDRVATLSGPSHAEEVCKGLPTSLVAAGADSHLTNQIQDYFNSDRFRVYTNPDVAGVEYAGALKNVVGIAAGICDGLKLGDNAKSAMLTRGLAEMTRFGVSLGAEAETFYGLAGLGDLITTCFSPHGRNRRVGQLLGEGQTLKAILASSPAIVEGVTTAKSIHERSGTFDFEMPITAGVYRVLYEDARPADEVNELMNRRSRSERG
jgi:glycerol-3-phosphate dehydrogenase (NAD(P)+)